MQVKIEFCWNGHNHEWRLTPKSTGKRTIMRACYDRWSRAEASRAKDLLVNDQGLVRKNIRFV